MKIKSINSKIAYFFGILVLLFGIFFMSINAVDGIIIDVSKDSNSLINDACSSDGAFEYDSKRDLITIKKEVIITGSTDKRRVEIAKNYKGKVIIRKLNIDFNDKTNYGAFRILNDAKITLVLEEENILVSGENKAGIALGDNSNLVVESMNDKASLNVVGGREGAGIGLEKNTLNTNSITINSGNINVIGGDLAAGIGGSFSLKESRLKNIIINGGNLTVQGGAYGSGIGLGAGEGYLESIIINSGKVNTIGGYGSSGIGSGYVGTHSKSIVRNIRINNGDINSQGGDRGSGIGSSYQNATGISKVENIVIGGGNLNAVGGDYSAGIGSANENGIGLSKVDKVLISGGLINVMGGDYGAGIGSGYANNKGSSEVDSISIYGGTIKAVKGYNAFADIGRGFDSEMSKVNEVIILGGSIKSTIISPNPTDKKNKVYLNKLRIGKIGLNNNKKIISGKINRIRMEDSIHPVKGYGIKDVKTDDYGYLYLYLPETKEKEEIEINIDGIDYKVDYRKGICDNDEILSSKLVDKDLLIKKPFINNNPQFSINGIDYSGVIEWYDENNNLVDSKFELNKKYKAKIILSALDGFRFSNDVEIKVNGVKIEDIKIIENNNANKLEFLFEFEKIENN